MQCCLRGRNAGTKRSLQMQMIGLCIPSDLAPADFFLPFLPAAPVTMATWGPIQLDFGLYRVAKTI